MRSLYSRKLSDERSLERPAFLEVCHLQRAYTPLLMSFLTALLVVVHMTLERPESINFMSGEGVDVVGLSRTSVGCSLLAKVNGGIDRNGKGRRKGSRKKRG